MKNKIKKQQDNNASFEGISEVEFNKRHMKALKDAEPSGQKKREKKMKDKIDTLKYGDLDLPITDCKVLFTNKQGKEYEVELTRLIQVFNNNIWNNKKSIK